MKIVLFVVFILGLQFSSQAQEVLSKIPVSAKTIASFIPKGYDTIEVVRGDLNKDGVEDIALALKHVDEDSFEMDEEPKRMLLVLLKQGAEYMLIGKSEKVLMCRHCGGAFGDPYAAISISNNILTIDHYGGSSWRWTNTQKFRYQQNAVFLIGSTTDSFWNVSDCDGNGVGDAGRKFKDTNWITGEQELIERDENCKLLTEKKVKLKRKQLVKLEAFKHEY